MTSAFVDIHIHTSDNPNKPKDNYEVDVLVEKVKKIAKGHPIILSLTDHNMLNKKAYLDLLGKVDRVLLGVELHIKKYDDAQPYHCHAIFRNEVSEEAIDKINEILDGLYPNKQVTPETERVPHIEDIANAFDAYDFMLLPHGGQSHKTFDKATGAGHRFDTSMEQSLYYNHFEGFTARSNSGLQETIDYFSRLGIEQFVNLVTCSDNYNPRIYPSAKENASEKFIPTWIFSQPSFDGLRMALSEKSRIHYGDNAPDEWNQVIYGVSLKQKKCDIDVKLLPGLNVVIGGSSSGKTLFVESLVSGIEHDFNENRYSKFGVENIEINNPSNTTPHYINQNFIMSILQNKDMDLGKIEIINEVFPEDKGVVEIIRKSLEKLRKLVEQLVDSAKEYQSNLENLKHLPEPSYLIMTKEIPQRIASLLKPDSENRNRFSLSESRYVDFLESLHNIKNIFEKSKLDLSYTNEINTIKKGLKYIYNLSNLSEEIAEVIENYETLETEEILDDDRENSNKINQRSSMVSYLGGAYKALATFYEAKRQLREFNVTVETRKIKVDDYTLSIENSFQLTPEVLKEAINRYLKSEYRIRTFDLLAPENIFNGCFSERPKVLGYDDFINRIYKDISSMNIKSYKIITNNGRSFESLSPGWKSAIILDLIIGYKNDNAPLIIDQPEDNLATDYINRGLVKRIKVTKPNKQIILVTHNATIPMLGDAQNVIVCKNMDGKITIKSAELESEIEEKRVLDLIAEITDGGKPSIRKRVKKYNLKNYKE